MKAKKNSYVDRVYRGSSFFNDSWLLGIADRVRWGSPELRVRCGGFRIVIRKQT